MLNQVASTAGEKTMTMNKSWKWLSPYTNDVVDRIISGYIFLGTTLMKTASRLRWQRPLLY